MRRVLLTMLAAMLFTATPVYAAETDGIMAFSALYSSDIEPGENDVFTIVYSDEAGHESELKFDASKYRNDTATVSVAPGTYTVTDVIYEGSNPEIDAQGFALNTKATIRDGGYSEITLAIGRQEGTLMRRMYSDVLAKVDGEPAGREFYDGEVTGNGITENAEEPETNPETNQETTEDTAKDTADDSEIVDDSETAEESEAKVIYEKKKQPRAKNLLMRGLPVLIAAAVTAIVVFVLHKKGRI